MLGALSLGDIIDALQELRPGILVVEAPPGDENDVSYGGSRSRMDVSRLRDDIGFTAEYDLAGGLNGYLGACLGIGRFWLPAR